LGARRPSALEEVERDASEIAVSRVRDGTSSRCRLIAPMGDSRLPSVVTPNPANGGHLKTGQWESNQDKP